MLDNELTGVTDLLIQLEQGSASHFSWSANRVSKFRKTIGEHGIRVRRNWALAVFSDRNNDAMRRYFRFHQKVIGDTLDRLENLEIILLKTNAFSEKLAELTGTFKQELQNLLHHLFDFYPDLFSQELPSPHSFLQRLSVEWRPDWNIVQNAIDHNKFDPQLAEILSSLLEGFEELGPNTRYSYQTVIYIKQLVERLSALCRIDAGNNTTEAVMQLLLAMNFNHLGFFCWYQQRMQAESRGDENMAKLEFFYERKTVFQIYFGHQQQAYDPKWPSISYMLVDWLKEEIAQLEAPPSVLTSAPPLSAHEKLILNIPAAYIACFIKLVFEGDWCKNITLTELFKFTVQHFESKRTENLSWRSLSKEYYSINQSTAARVKEILQGMILYINRQYFPVWVAISAAICFS